MKYIREARMGPPKVGKSPAIYSSYPRPILAIVSGRREVDSINDPIEWTTFDSVPSLLDKKREEQPPITALDFWGDTLVPLNEVMGVNKDSKSLPRFNALGNLLYKAKNMPWKTVVIDNLTRLSDQVTNYLAHSNEKIMADARFWSPIVGLKMFQIMAFFTTLPCHVVFTLHVKTDKNELTQEVRTEPMFFSQKREDFPSICSQVLYQDYIGGKPMVYTKPVAFAPGLGTIKGIGCTWPANLPSPCGPLFNDIYGEAVKNGETSA